MTLYVESNFVLEIVLGQEESEPAEWLLNQAERGHIQLALPTFALSEPFSTVTGRKRNRGRLVGQINSQLEQLSRSSPHQRETVALHSIPDIVARIDDREAERLSQTIERLLGTARRIETDLAVFREARELQTRFDLGAQDAIILAAVFADLRARAEPGPHYFANRNRRDFDVPEIQAALQTFDCTLTFSFAEATGLLGSKGQE